MGIQLQQVEETDALAFGLGFPLGVGGGVRGVTNLKQAHLME
jgi:hypothetical protein